MEIWNREMHYNESQEERTCGAEECAGRFSTKSKRRSLRAFAKAWPVIGRERQLIAELVRRGQCGRAEERLVAVSICACDDVDRLILVVVFSCLQTKEVQRKVHRRIPYGVRWLSARSGKWFNEIVPLPSARERLNVGLLASNPVKRRHRLPTFTLICFYLAPASTLLRTVFSPLRQPHS